MSKTVLIQAIHRELKLAVTDDNRIGKIITWLDGDGEETDELSKAVGAVIKLGEKEYTPIFLDDYPEDNLPH